MAARNLIFVLYLFFIFFIVFRCEIFKSHGLSLILLLRSQNRKLFIAFGLIIGFLITPSLLSGRFIAEMNSVYSQHDIQISVDISETGYRSEGVFVDLYNIGSKVT